MASDADPVRDLLARLRAPVSDLPTLLSLLCSALASLHLLPPQYAKYDAGLVALGALSTRRHVPSIQGAILESIAPTWESVLAEEGHASLLETFFCPDHPASEVPLLAYASILALPLTPFSVRLLARLARDECAPLDRLHAVVFATGSADAPEKKMLIWEDCIRNVVAVPAKVANAAGTRALAVPPALEQAAYSDALSRQCERLLATLARSPATPETEASLTLLLAKLVNVGLFPAFWAPVLPAVRRRLRGEGAAEYARLWAAVLRALPSAMAQQRVFAALLAALDADVVHAPLGPSVRERAAVRREAALVRGVFGPLGGAEMWENAGAVVLDRAWDAGVARVVVCWVAGAGANEDVDYEGGGATPLEVFLNRILEMWAAPEYIKHALLAQHHYLTTLLLLTVSYFPPGAPALSALSMSPAFIAGVGAYISALDPAVRRCGMLAAEVVAARTDKTLSFGDWEGEEHGRPWARALRDVLAARDVDADLDVLGCEAPDDAAEPSEPAEEPAPARAVLSTGAGYDSDDSLTGYASPPSSRAASPTPSELDEIERDPTLRVGAKRVARPVYLVQLGELVRGTQGGAPELEADRLEMALACGEALVRRKQGYGTELEENAVNLVYGFVGLQDNFDLPDFERKRQDILTALVACCPRIAAPSIIEEFFKNQYSTGQRYAMLNALAIAARELAALPIPASIASPQAGAAAFPSKQLPAALHREYLALGGQDAGPVQLLLDGISRAAIDRGRDATADKVPRLVRERQLRLRKPATIAEVRPGVVAVDNGGAPPPPPREPFTEVAAAHFVAPLINRFWLFLRNEQTREARTALQAPLYRYRGAGTGLVLNPVVLTHFLGTLAVLVHASQHAPQWLAVLAPDALELAVTLGTRPVGQSEDDNLGGEGQAGKQAAVLTAALELVLIILDGCLELDDGRSIGLDHTALLLGAGEWAQEVFANLEKGARVEGGGGAQEVRLKRAAAGVLLKVDELTSRWRRSMVDVR
ncbi:hypothetical protein HWV62_23130 [Athelia sp. TMB]|nr:hypothetical protein HWV62_23130 [Athelia sp. TMB]